LHTIPDVKRTQRILNLLALSLVLLLAARPATTWAEDSLPVSAHVVPPVLITEIQPGTGASASEEFIELYNTTTAPIDFTAHDWRLDIASTTALNWESPFRSVPLVGSIAPGQSYLIASQFTSNGQPVQYLAGKAQTWFSAGISATAGHVRLTYDTNQVADDSTCGAFLTVVDEVEWSTPKNGTASIASLDNRTVLLTAGSTGVAKATSLQRQVDTSVLHSYIDTGSDAADIVAGSPSPGLVNGATLLVVPPLVDAGVVPLPADTCDPSPPPAGPGTGEPPQDDTSGAPPGSDPTSSPPGTTDGDSISDPPALSANAGLLAPQISEVLPNPAAPQNDATDEFIELYNPNDQPFDLSGFSLQAGITTKHSYIFPAGTLLPAQSFVAYFSATTHLSLANTDGQVALLDPFGTLLAQTGDYGAAKDGQAWIFADGAWQWTTIATPNAPNTVKPPVVVPKVTAKAKTPAKAAVAKKPTSVKGVTTKAAKPAKPKKQAASTKMTTVSSNTPKSGVSPLHPGVLAVAAGFALLYGAYEYRNDLANKFHKLRSNRTARREARRVAKRRGGN